ncbi:MAG: VWA domain-containing protein, partial [Planctomycetes bacterium]|nr:VWA domain-containing protein [Planctomycetota bacterium]
MASKPPPLRRTATQGPVPLAEQDDAQLDEGELQADDLDDVEFEEHSTLMRFVYGFGSCGISLMVHLVGLILLAYLTVPTQVRNVPALVEAIFDPRTEEDPVEIELDPDIQIATEFTAASVSSSPMASVSVGAEGTIGTPVLDQKVLKEAATGAEVSEITIDPPLAGAPSFGKLIEAISDKEFKGDPRAIIDNYQEAMDRIAQELMWMMDKGPVLVVWAFDQSGSMKDDQQEIRERINNVYLQLGLVGRNQAQFLETSIVSYGEGYVQHTKRPTADIDEIRAAIDAIPEDETGKEMMCQAVGRAISQHRQYVKRGGRQMALILVSDESGEPEDNAQYLEPMIDVAKEAGCRIYVLGREAVSGYPYVHIRWRHPQTHQPHWLAINRGPETGFVEQLQIDGFRRRHDAFPSGFGPYEQCRMARETGGHEVELTALADR